MVIKIKTQINNNFYVNANVSILWFALGMNQFVYVLLFASTISLPGYTNNRLMTWVCLCIYTIVHFMVFKDQVSVCLCYAGFAIVPQPSVNTTRGMRRVRLQCEPIELL